MDFSIADVLLFYVYPAQSIPRSVQYYLSPNTEYYPIRIMIIALICVARLSHECIHQLVSACALAVMVSPLCEHCAMSYLDKAAIQDPRQVINGWTYAGQGVGLLGGITGKLKLCSYKLTIRYGDSK